MVVTLNLTEMEKESENIIVKVTERRTRKVDDFKKTYDFDVIRKLLSLN